ncbi:MAG: LexA family transcriptional regulator [Acidobacteria bacterium]|nr:LexA family transcriptional regulator [Acidobacteriota bacterium]
MPYRHARSVNVSGTSVKPLRSVLCSPGMLGKRLTASRGRAGLTQEQLAAALGPRYDQAMVSRVESGQKTLRFEGVIKAATELDVSVDYLAGLTDDPAPAARLAEELARERARKTELEDSGALARARSRAGVRAAEGSPRPHLFARPGIKPVPLLQDAGIAAGAGGDADHEHVLSYVPFRDNWLRSHNLNAARCVVIEVIGKSMEPTIEHRAVILVDLQRTERRQNRIFAVRDADGPIVKRLRYENDNWWLDSDNEETDVKNGQRIYPARRWPEDASVLGQVMWTGRTL